MRRFSIFLALFALAVLLSSCNHASKTVKIATKGKYTILVFDSTTCPYCKKLKNDFEHSKIEKKYLKKMTVYFIHTDENKKYLIPSKNGQLKLKAIDFAIMYGFRGLTPYVVITDKNLKAIAIVPGYLPPDTFVKVLSYVDTKAYKTMSLKEYLSTP